MRMNLLSDFEGNLYFNELLYSTLKLSYYKDIFNEDMNQKSLKIMNVIEKNVLKKLEDVTRKVLFKLKNYSII